MLYQVRSHGQLCQAKKYLKQEDILYFIDKIIKKTETHRKTLNINEIRKLKFGMKVTKDELIESLEVTKINEELLPNYLIILGKEIEITNPIDLIEIEQEKKIEARMRRESLLQRV
jgi:hypothetical protein